MPANQLPFRSSFPVAAGGRITMVYSGCCGRHKPGGEFMPSLIERPTRVAAAGQPPKLIDEYVGRVNTGEARVSVAHMRSPAGWVEPGQTPEFDEYTVVLAGVLRVEHRGGVLEVRAGQAVLARAG